MPPAGRGTLAAGSLPIPLSDCPNPAQPHSQPAAQPNTAAQAATQAPSVHQRFAEIAIHNGLERE